MAHEISPLGLGPVQCPVRSNECVIEGFSACMARNADRNRDFRADFRLINGYRLSQAVGNGACQRRRSAGQKNHELLAAPACKQVFFPQHIGGCVGYVAQHPVANLMAIAVVDRLEMIQVQQ